MLTPLPPPLAEEETRTGPAASASKKAKDSKPVLLKDYQRARMLADPTAEQTDEVSADGFARTFAEESLLLKDEVTRAFAEAGSDDDDMDGLLVRREKTQDEREKDDAEYERFLKANAGDREIEDAMEQEEKFLRESVPIPPCCGWSSPELTVHCIHILVSS